MSEKKTILLVDDSISLLRINKEALSIKYNVVTAISGYAALECLEQIIPDLILLDIEMPDMNGYELLKLLKKRVNLQDVPVIFLTASSNPESELYGLTLGAVDYIIKPYSIPLLMKRVEMHITIVEQRKSSIIQQKQLKDFNDNLSKMIGEKTATIKELQDAILYTFAELVESRDGTTGGHIVRTQFYIKALICELRASNMYVNEIADWDINLLIQSVQLHDVGKIAVPDYILLKQGNLTSKEYEEIKKHALKGAEIIERIAKMTTEKAFLEYAATLARSHHERWDGSGYPFGLKGEQIPLQGRLMAIADVYDALITARPYKPAYKHKEAIHIIVEGRGKHFDPLLVEIFLKAADQFEFITKIFDNLN